MGNSLCLCRALSIYEFKSDRLLAEGAQQGEAALAVALLPVLSLTSAQELPLPGIDTGDETWFEAVSLRPPLSLLGEASVLSSPQLCVRVEA